MAAESVVTLPVCIRAKLLGVTRDYWLAVRFKSAEGKADKAEKADDEKAADVVKSKGRKAVEGKKMAKTNSESFQCDEDH